MAIRFHVCDSSNITKIYSKYTTINGFATPFIVVV
jgi:hypothetical protein